MIREAKRFNVAACGRQIGKTTLGIDRLARAAANGQPTAWFAPTYKYVGYMSRFLLAVTAAAFTGTAALVGIFGVALMRAAFEFALHFARTEKRGGVHAIIEHQAVGYALADAKTTIEAARYLSWKAAHYLDLYDSEGHVPGAWSKITTSASAISALAAARPSGVSMSWTRRGVTR